MQTIWPLPKIEFTPFAEREESQPVAILTSPPAWNAVGHLLRFPAVYRLEVGEASLSAWDALIPRIHAGVIYAVGGGLTADAAKYCAARLELPLVCLPTALSVDAFLTWASGIAHELAA